MKNKNILSMVSFISCLLNAITKQLLLMFPVKFLTQQSNLIEGEIVINLQIKKKYKLGKLWAIDALFENKEKVQILVFSQKMLNIFFINNVYKLYGKLEQTKQGLWQLKSPKILNSQFNDIIPVYGTSISSLLHKLII